MNLLNNNYEMGYRAYKEILIAMCERLQAQLTLENANKLLRVEFLEHETDIRSTRYLPEYAARIRVDGFMVIQESVQDNFPTSEVSWKLKYRALHSMIYTLLSNGLMSFHKIIKEREGL